MMADTIETRSDKMNKKLINAVIENLGYDDLNDPDCIEDLRNITNHGIDCGYGGFVYYSETTSFFNENRKEIIELVKEMSFEFGEGMIELVASFNCLKDMDVTLDEIGNVLFCVETDNRDEKMLIKNALSWFAGEEVARHLVDQLEEV
jgi:hypothetical protein